ncbi:heme-dependent oxidative N-demethylase family protein [Roseibium sp. SCP14]|uniref:heme-dependent oxidative N-demethylase family protein n=1 Tax=Roseibium sp. SCP14 TaxID=3141375 RepID=UPI00333A8BCE
MSFSSSPSFQHTPYDGTSQPFTVGLKPIDEAIWLEPDPFFAVHLAEKERLYSLQPDSVFREEAGTEAAQAEVLALITDNLSRFHGATHQIASGSVGIPTAGREVSLTDKPALLTASRLVQEDLILMRPGDDGYRLVAASLCFPSSWSLAEKFGKSMSGIHEGVPGFNGSRMGQMVARLFDNLKVDQLVCRFNWSIHPDSDLHHPLPKDMRFDCPDQALASLFLRVERQTLRRLPESGDILFAIKIHHDPLAALKTQDDRADIAGGLHKQLLALDDDQLDYKGLGETRDALAGALEGFFTESAVP